jgi:hypothetical protein
MEKRKTIWFYVPISTLIKAAEEKSNVKVQFSHDELMTQILDNNYSGVNISPENILKDILGGQRDKKEKKVAIKLNFEHNYLKKIVEESKGYSTSISWKDALYLALDNTNWCLNIPATVKE